MGRPGSDSVGKEETGVAASLGLSGLGSGGGLGFHILGGDSTLDSSVVGQREGPHPPRPPIVPETFRVLTRMGQILMPIGNASNEVQRDALRMEGIPEGYWPSHLSSVPYGTGLWGTQGALDSFSPSPSPDDNILTSDGPDACTPGRTVEIKERGGGRFRR